MALRRRLPVLSTEQAHGGTDLHQLQEVRTSQWKHQMLPHHPQLCAAQRAGGPRHAEPTLSLPKRLPAEGLAMPTRLLRPCPPPGRASSGSPLEKKERKTTPKGGMGGHSNEESFLRRGCSSSVSPSRVRLAFLAAPSASRDANRGMF